LSKGIKRRGVEMERTHKQLCFAFLNLVPGEIRIFDEIYTLFGCPTLQTVIGNSYARRIAHQLGEIFGQFVLLRFKIKEECKRDSGKIYPGYESEYGDTLYFDPRIRSKECYEARGLAYCKEGVDIYPFGQVPEAGTPFYKRNRYRKQTYYREHPLEPWDLEELKEKVSTWPEEHVEKAYSLWEKYRSTPGAIRTKGLAGLAEYALQSKEKGRRARYEKAKETEAALRESGLDPAVLGMFVEIGSALSHPFGT
jgi:hypothetical protein